MSKVKTSKIPDLIDIIQLWSEEEKSGYKVVRVGHYKNIGGEAGAGLGWRDYAVITAGLTTFSLGYVYATHVQIKKSAKIYHPEDPEFFNKLRKALTSRQ